MEKVNSDIYFPWLIAANSGPLFPANGSGHLLSMVVCIWPWLSKAMVHLALAIYIDLSCEKAHKLR